MKEYLAMYSEGPSSIERRQAFWVDKEARLKAEVSEIKASIKYIAWKQDLYKIYAQAKHPM